MRTRVVILGVLITLAAWAGACSAKKNDSSTMMDPAVGANAGAGGTSAAPNMPATGTGGSAAPTGMNGMSSGSGGSNASSGTGGSSDPDNTTGTGGKPAMMSSDGGMPMADGGGDEEACDMQVTPSMDCTAMLAPGDERTCMLGSREYIVYAGKTLNLCKPTALVIDAHGATETDKQQTGEEEFCASGGICWHGLGSGWKAEADQVGAGFIVVFPQGVNNMWSDTDADFMVQLVDEMKKVADIDPNKVYISGISNGGFLTYWTGCPHSDVFRGMSPNAGGATCTSVAKPVPVIAFDDSPDFAYQSSVDAANAMVMLNNCKGASKDWVKVDEMYKEPVCRSAKSDVNAKLVPCTDVGMPIEPTTCKVWDECDQGVQVVFCEVAANTEHGAGNEALDGHIIYENNTLLNTPSLAWRFFKQFW
jgi:poly(3-hydroxybutyrate) depolymerase